MTAITKELLKDNIAWCEKNNTYKYYYKYCKDVLNKYNKYKHKRHYETNRVEAMKIFCYLYEKKLVFSK